MEIPVSIAVSNTLTSSQTTEEYIPSNIQLPKQLESVKACQAFPSVRHRWNTNEEIASVLLAFSRHADWQKHEVRQRPPSGCMLLFNRNSVRYRKDGYCWKKRKDGKTIREDHMKLKVQGLECIYGSYVHSAILPTFHRRCYWLLQNPDIVLVHYLNVPYPNNTKLSIPVMNIAMEKKEWTKEELVAQLKPMFSSNEEESLPVLDETIMTLVQRLMDNQAHYKSDSGVYGPECQQGVSLGTSTGVSQHSIRQVKQVTHCCNHSSLHPQSHSACNVSGQSQINLAQGPLILNLGNIGSGQMMIVTSQNEANQLSILSNSNTNNTRLQQQQQTPEPPREVTKVENRGGNPPSHILCRSASLCDPHNDLNHSMMPRSLSQDGNVNSTVDSTSIVADVPFMQQSIGNTLCNNMAKSTISCFQSMEQNTSSSNTAQQMETKSESLKTMTTTHSCESSVGQTNVSPMSAPTNYNSMFSSNSGNNDSLVTSFLDELSSELMTPEKYSPMEEGKKAFSHLGDSFESLQGTFNSLQDSELNLDQLFDMPDLDRLYKDLTNSGGLSELPISMNLNNGNSGKPYVSTSQKTNLQTVTSLSQPSTSSFHSNTLPMQGVGSNENSTNDLDTLCVNSSMQGQGQTSRGQQSLNKEEYMVHTTKTPCTIASITDFSPDWAYTEGQTKVLVTGPWHSNMGNYSVLLDGKIIATTLVQPGVLRCFVPGHHSGPVTLQVSCDGTVISNNVTFEYKDRPKHVFTDSPSQVQDWFSVEESKLIQLLIKKVDRIETALSKVPDSACIKQVISNTSTSTDVDFCLTQHIDSLSTRLWTSNDLSIENGTMGLSLLHLAAALGYHRFINVLTKWRNDNPSWFLEYEVDAHSTDLNSCTPLMWACARGHTEAALILYNWNKGPLHSFNKEGNLPLLVARQHGHHRLADQLEQLDLSPDLSHDLTSSRSSMLSSADIFPSQSYNNAQHLGTMCSNLNSISTESSNLEKTYFSTDYTVATATNVVMKETPVSFSSSQPSPDTVNVLGALHIDISPSVTSEDSKPLNQSEREQPSHDQGNQSTSSTVTCPSKEKLPILSSSSSSLSTAERRQKLRKRFSVDIISNQTLEPVHFSPTTAFQRPVREANSEPHLAANMEHLLCPTNPMLSEGRDMGSPELLVQLDHCERHGNQCNTQETTTTQQDSMDTDNVSEGSITSFIDVERVSSDDEDIRQKILSQDTGNPQPQMVHLAKQIIAAMPERIKSSPSRGEDTHPEEFQRERSSSYSSLQSSASPRAPSSYGEALSSYGEDSGISTPMHDSLAFDEYRYPDVYSDLGTPASSLSPDSTCLHSPYSPYTFHMDSPPPTAAEFIEYFNAPATFMEKDFSQLTLSDREQRKLYEAAKVIQSAYRQYKDKQCKQQAKEREAAVLIQSYYRRYKQYAYYKKMTQAAVLIQSQFRSYYAQKRFKKSRDAAVVIQNQYRSYKEHERLKKGGNKSVTQRFRSHYQRKPIGPGKGSRVVQIIPDTEGSQAEAVNTPIEECPQDTTKETESPVCNDEEREVTPTDIDKGE
ncbi:transcription by RNA polymerase II [Mactra antiquata]